MKHYRIENTISGADLGTYYAGSVQEALDMQARAAGYTDYADLENQIPAEDGEILVSPVTAYAVYEAAFEDDPEYSEAGLLEYIGQYADSAMGVALSVEEAQTILDCYLAWRSGEQDADTFWHTVEKPLSAIEV